MQDARQSIHPAKGLRWEIPVDGKGRIFWGATASDALAEAAKRHPTATLGVPRPAAPDWRAAKRGGGKTKQIAVRVTQAQFDRLKARWRASGTPTFAAWLLERILRD